MVSFDTVIAPLSVALGLSLMVERVLEVVKSVFEPFILKPKTAPLPALSEVEKNVDTAVARQAGEHRRISQEEEARELREQISTAASPEAKKALAKKLAVLEQHGEWGESVPHTSLLAVEPARPPDMVKVLRDYVLQLLGLAVGILLARAFELQLFHAFLPDSATLLSAAEDYILTGILIGGGSAPVHLLIRFISERRVTPAAAPLDRKEAEPAPPPAVAPAAANALLEADWIDIPYDGGVDCALLERVHIRRQNPDMIVVHHTAMSSRSTFEDVVRTIKDRTDGSGNHWITGYHCVVQADGSIHPFCRYDRYGNHAVGYNERSLGLAFNGNFEPDPKVPYSNPDGRYGATRPTDAQLRAGARVVALWVLLYGVKIDFEKQIIPHRKVSSKTCPGSAFPWQEFETLVRQYVKRWTGSAAVKEQIASYKRKPYLYV